MTHLSLRKSCDRCHEAKLKCVFDGSSSECCTRCRSRGADCVRSQSKPYGRTPGSRNKKRKRSQEPAQEPTPPLSQDGNSTSPCPDINTDDFWSGVQGWDLLDGKLSEDTSLGTNSTSTDSDLTTPPYDWLDTNTLSSIEDYTGTFSDYCSPLASFTGPDSFGLDASTASEVSQSAAAFDDVLKWTQTATSALRSFLACESEHGASVPLVFHNLTQTIVATFREALHTSCTWPQPIWSCDEAARIQMGSCTIDADGEDGAALRRQVVLFGLRKVDSLLQQLEKQSSGRGGKVEHLFPLLLSGLRAGLDAAMRQASY